MFYSTLLHQLAVFCAMKCAEMHGRSTTPPFSRPVNAGIILTGFSSYHQQKTGFMQIIGTKMHGGLDYLFSALLLANP